MAWASQLWDRNDVRAASARLHAAIPDVEQETVSIQQIPAPTFTEAARAEYVRQRLQALGLLDVQVDEEGNVTGRAAGREPGLALAVTAHLDTVFGAETDLTARREDGSLWGPGIGDNSLGVSGLLALAAQARELKPRRDIWFIGNVGEEGLGNLQGMWTTMRRLRDALGSVIVLEGGAFGTIIHRGIGVQRRRLTVRTAGGHAWSDFGTPSAIHELCRVGSAIADMQIPTDVPTSFNLGTIEGGTSVNTIAATATALLDLRSEEPDALDRLARQLDAILESARRDGVTITSETIGERPAGGIPPTHPLVRAALASLERVGYHTAHLRAASTDANVPYALGLPAVCIGLTVGHNAHRLDEYVELAPLASGLEHALLVMVAALEMLP